MSQAESYKIVLITDKPDLEKEIFNVSFVTIIEKKNFSNIFVDNKIKVNDDFKNIEEKIAKKFLKNKNDKILILFHSSELETFRLCMELRNSFSSQFTNTYFFTYSIGGRGLRHHYGFVFDKKKYHKKSDLLEDFQVSKHEIEDENLMKFRLDFLSELKLDSWLNYFQYSTFYPSQSILPTNNGDKNEEEVKFYNDVEDKWGEDFNFCFHNETIIEENYPLNEYKNFYYTEDDTKNNYYDMRRYFYDSSIWFRYMYDVNGILQTKKIKIYSDKYKDYLNLLNSKTSKFFHIRMFENSFVLGGESSHGQHIIPFKFHSETLMENGAEMELERIKSILKDTSLKSWEWDIKLLDDYAESSLKGSDSEMKFTTGIYKDEIMSKGNIIRHTLGLDTDGSLQLENVKILLKIKCQQEFPDLENDKDWYRGFTDDILLIDYLFTQHTNDGTYRFGDEVVKYLVKGNNKNNLPPYRSALGKKWIFPVSAFNFVFADSLSSQGIDYYNTNMILSQGGDPITTPNLFRYRFFKFLRLQLEELSSKNKLTLSKIIREITNQPDLVNIKKYIVDSFPEIVKVISKHKDLAENFKTSSFAKSAIKNFYFDEEDKDSIISIQNFLFRLGFGDSQDLPRMAEIWEDLRVGSELKNEIGKLLHKYRKLNQ